MLFKTSHSSVATHIFCTWDHLGICVTFTYQWYDGTKSRTTPSLLLQFPPPIFSPISLCSGFHGEEIWLSWSYQSLGTFQSAKVDEDFRQASQGEKNCSVIRAELHMVWVIGHGVHTENKLYIKYLNRHYPSSAMNDTSNLPKNSVVVARPWKTKHDVYKVDI